MTQFHVFLALSISVIWPPNISFNTRQSTPLTVGPSKDSTRWALDTEKILQAALVAAFNQEKDLCSRGLLRDCENRWIVCSSTTHISILRADAGSSSIRHHAHHSLVIKWVEQWAPGLGCADLAADNKNCRELQIILYFQIIDNLPWKWPRQIGQTINCSHVVSSSFGLGAAYIWAGWLDIKTFKNPKWSSLIWIWTDFRCFWSFALRVALIHIDIVTQQTQVIKLECLQSDDGWGWRYWPISGGNVGRSAGIIWCDLKRLW